MAERKGDESTKHSMKNKKSNSTEARGELRLPRKVSSTCSTSGTNGVKFVINPVISHKWGKDQTMVIFVEINSNNIEL